MKRVKILVLMFAPFLKQGLNTHTYYGRHCVPISSPLACSSSKLLNLNDINWPFVVIVKLVTEVNIFVPQVK